MIIRVLEIGVAVLDLAQSAHRLACILGGRIGKSIAAPEYQMTAQMVRVGNIEFELMEPMGPAGLIKKFIRQRGQGLHHIAFQVDDVAQTLKELMKLGIKALHAEPIQTHGMKAAFLRPDSLCGVLFELIEGSPGWIDGRPLPSQLQKPLQEHGVGAEGLLSIGIMVEDVAAASEKYSNAFGGRQAKTFCRDGKESGGNLCRAGNADLLLMPAPRQRNGSGPFFSAKRPGLHHVVIKVQDLGRSAEFLNRHSIDFQNDCSFSDYPGRLIALNPEQFSGVPILLGDSHLRA